MLEKIGYEKLGVIYNGHYLFHSGWPWISKGWLSLVLPTTTFPFTHFCLCLFWPVHIVSCWFRWCP